MEYIIYILIILVFICLNFIINTYIESKYKVYNLSKRADGSIIKNFIFDINLPFYYAHNSSIIKNKDGYNLYTRYSTYNCNILSLINREKDKINNFKYYTQEFIIKSYLDKNFNIKDYKLLTIGLPYENIHDLRVFNFKNKNYLLGTYQYNNLKDYYTCPVLVDDNMNYIKLYITNIDDIKQTTNKNWAPLINKNKLFLIHKHNPLIIVEPNLETGKCNIIFKGKYQKNIPNISGSTPYINIGKNRYLGLVHYFFYILGKRHYIHYFVIINYTNDKNPFIEKLSKSICFEGNCGIEFAMGLIESHDNKSFIVTYGKNDCSSKALILSKASVFSLF